MGTINTYVAYHATDASNVLSIIESNFKFNEKNTHWLGNGVYFFLDKSLAFYWGENCPTTKYGIIKNPAIIEATIHLDNDYVCDMRELKIYNNVKKAFDIFWKYAYKAHCTVEYDHSFYEKLECAFFNWLTSKWNLNCIICNFEKRNMRIIESENSNHFDKFRLVYVETQMCVKNIDFIDKREEIKK